MDSGERFSISFITCDRHRGKGGELIEVLEATKSGWLSPEQRKQQKHLQPESAVSKRHPRHYENSTRNICLTANGDIRKVHIRLIRKFNGRVVL